MAGHVEETTPITGGYINAHWKVPRLLGCAAQRVLEGAGHGDGQRQDAFIGGGEPAWMIGFRP